MKLIQAGFTPPHMTSLISFCVIIAGYTVYDNLITVYVFFFLPGASNGPLMLAYGSPKVSFTEPFPHLRIRIMHQNVSQRFWELISTILLRWHYTIFAQRSYKPNSEALNKLRESSF